MGRRPKNKVTVVKKIGKKRKTRTSDKPASKFIPSMDLQEVYTIINEVQIKRVEKIISIQIIDVPVLENILRDCALIWKKKESKENIEYLLQPALQIEEKEEDYEFDDDYEDELKDDDQIF